MPNDHNASQGRRPHYHRGRRGGDRRPPDRRPTPGPQEQAGRDQVDVEQIMRDIRARIAKRHGIDLTPQQIRELAARRLDAILEPRHVAPSLMEQMRRAAGQPIEVPAPRADARAELDESALYASHRGLLRQLRRWLNPIMKLFFNPAPLVETLRDLTRRSNAAAAREAELHARQAEWNALHFEILQRLVTEVSRATIDVQGLAARVESLAAKVDFTERQVRSLEAGAPAAVRPAIRPVDHATVEPDRQVAGNPTGASPPQASTSTDSATEGQRRRRRRRRGRRGGGPPTGDSQPLPAQLSTAPGADVDADIDGEGDLEGDADGDMEGSEPVSMTGPEDGTPESGAALEPVASFQLPREPAPRSRDQPDVTAAPIAPASSERIETTPAADVPAEPLPRRDEPGAPEQ